MKAAKKEEPLAEEAESIGIFEVKTHLARLVREVQAGKRFVITQRGKPVAELNPLAVPEGKGFRGDMKGKIWMADDFCDPLPELEKYFT